jgi:release factor H-coupled RctB family protein
MRLIASSTSWIEGEAIQQLEASAALPGVRWVVGMPDLHPGKGHPVGIAAMADGVVYPHLVGADIGCGMALFTTRTPVRKLDVTRAAKRLRGLEEPWGEDPEAFLAEQGVGHRGHLNALGTIGGGNHFAELQRVEERADPEAAAAMLGSDDRVLLLVHSGSRGFGEQTMRSHTERRGAAPLEASSEEGQPTSRARRCGALGTGNRLLIARRIATLLGLVLEPLIDLVQRGAAFRRWLAAPEGRGPA